MDAFAGTLLAQLGLLLVARLIRGPENTADLEDRIVAADTPEKVQAIAIEQVAALMAGDESTKALICDLVKAQSSDEVKAAVAKPQNTRTLLTGLADLVGDLVKAILGIFG